MWNQLMFWSLGREADPNFENHMNGMTRQKLLKAILLSKRCTSFLLQSVENKPHNDISVWHNFLSLHNKCIELCRHYVIITLMLYGVMARIPVYF